LNLDVEPERLSSLPIFALGLVLVPGEVLPLHIFEPRYRRMTEHCLAADEPFGILLADEGEDPRVVGCTARITQVLERFDDGRTSILTVGETPFRVLEHSEGPDFPTAFVELLEDEGGPGDAAAAREAFADLAEHASGERPDADELAEVDAYAVSGRVELPLDIKQALLEFRSEPERLELLVETLRSLDQNLRAAEGIQERASSNGKVAGGH